MCVNTGLPKPQQCFWLAWMQSVSSTTWESRSQKEAEGVLLWNRLQVLQCSPMVNLACLADICADQSSIPALATSEPLCMEKNITGPTVCHQRQLQRQATFIQQNTLNLDVWFRSLFWWNLSNWKCQKLTMWCNMSSQDAWLKSFRVSALAEFVDCSCLYNSYSFYNNNNNKIFIIFNIWCSWLSCEEEEEEVVIVAAQAFCSQHFNICIPETTGGTFCFFKSTHIPMKCEGF